MIKEQIMNDVLEIFRNNKSRLKHILGVLETATELGIKYHADVEKLEISALLHDITKYNSGELNKQIIKEYFSNFEEIFNEFSMPLLHSFSAYVIAQEKYGIKDEDILNAILHHTVGRANMSLIEKIIFISDYIEPNRTYLSCVKVRAIAQNSLDEAVFVAIDDTIKYHEALKEKISNQAYKARDFYRKTIGGQHG